MKDISDVSYSTSITSQAMGIDNATNELDVLTANNIYSSNNGDIGFNFPIDKAHIITIKLIYDSGSWINPGKTGYFSIYGCEDENKTNSIKLGDYAIDSNKNLSLTLLAKYKYFYISDKQDLNYLKINSIDDNGQVYVNDKDYTLEAQNKKRF